MSLLLEEYNLTRIIGQQNRYLSGNTHDSLLNQIPGKYYIEVHSAYGTEVVRDSIIITEPNAMQISSTKSLYPDSFNISCYHCYNGSVTAFVTANGHAPYSFVWSSGQSTAAINSLGPGIYTVNVTDSLRCTASRSDTLSEEGNQWNKTGDALSTDTTKFLGTTDATKLVIKTNNTERMVVGETGEVFFKSDVFSNKISVSRIASIDSLLFFGSATIIFNTLRNRIYPDRLSSSSVKGLSIGGYSNSIGAGSLALGYYSQNNSDYSIIVGEHNLAEGDHSILLGNFLRTTSAATNSIIIGSMSSGTTLFTATSPNTIYMGMNSTIPTVTIFPATSTTSAGCVAIAYDRVPADGNLAVGGKIYAEEIKVQLKGLWPDFVFNNNTNLLSIHQLKDFISINKHLPGIPSSKEIKQNDGFELGQMQVKLLEKLEEQTLYIIGLQEQIDELKRQLIKLKN